MQKMPSVADFDNLFAPKKTIQRFRTKKHVVVRTGKALRDYWLHRQVRHNVSEQIAALQEIARASGDYCDKKIGGAIATKPKHVFMRDLNLSARTLLQEISDHAARAHATFAGTHHGTMLNSAARHAAQRISTGVNLLPQYRLEKFTAKTGPDVRVHAGTFFERQNRSDHGGDIDWASMSPVEVYSLVKKFKHTNYLSDVAFHLDYFTAADRATKLLTPGAAVGTVNMGGVPADTFGSIEKKRFDDTGRASAGTGRMLPQASGGADGEAIYVCSIEGDFYVHMDLPSHAGSYQHSSVMAGAEITCAGTMFIENGRVLILTNSSGHYRPSVEDLHDAVVAMVEELDIVAASVMIIATTADGYYLLSGAGLLALSAGGKIQDLPAMSYFKLPDAFRCEDLLALARNELQDQQKSVNIYRKRFSGWVTRNPVGRLVHN